MKISYISAGLAAVTAALCCRYYFVMAENAKIRMEAIEFQQLAETLQPQLLAKRQQLQAQQEKLNKGSAISQTVGPAVLADIRSAADKSNNFKLKELLAKYGVHETGASGTTTGASGTTTGASGTTTGASGTTTGASGATTGASGATGPQGGERKPTGAGPRAGGESSSSSSGEAGGASGLKKGGK